MAESSLSHLASVYPSRISRCTALASVKDLKWLKSAIKFKEFSRDTFYMCCRENWMRRIFPLRMFVGVPDERHAWATTSLRNTSVPHENRQEHSIRFGAQTSSLPCSWQQNPSDTITKKPTVERETFGQNGSVLSQLQKCAKSKMGGGETKFNAIHKYPRMFSYKTGIILLVNYPIVYENISPGTYISLEFFSSSRPENPPSYCSALN